MTPRLGAFLLVLAAAWPGGAGTLGAQGLGNIQKSDDPLEINAEEGIEWRQEEKVYIARGNTRAASGDLEVFSDVLKAYYREAASGSTEIYLLEALGNVRVVSPNEIAYGDRGQYIVDEQRVELRGDNLLLESKDKVSRITARDTLEYWEVKQLAVARGDAQANHEDKQVNADTLVAHFRPNDKDETEIRQIVATGNVRITTPTDYVVGDEGVYYVQEEVATLTGDVKITRDGNQMNGNYAEVNLATGISQLRGNVDALILPKAKPEEDEAQ
jgi:lipopolysaccharide export system protein LptA